MGIESWAIAQTPFAVIDCETTGTNPGLDRMVEFSVIRLNPQVGRPEVAFDSLLNPKQPIGLDHVHGVTTELITDAPTFADVAAMVVEALSGAVLAAHNAYFDMRFLTAEFRRVGVELDLPYICTMQLRPLLGLGPLISLEEACREHGIQLDSQAHVASNDASAAAMLLLNYRNTMLQQGIQSFSQLAARAGRKERFPSSFRHQPLHGAVAANLRSPGQTKTRNPIMVATFGTGSHVAVRREDYTQALLNAVSDYVLDPEEFAYLMRIREQADLTEAQIRAAHVKVYDWVLQMFVQDERIDDDERQKLNWLHGCLRQLGWAPGD